VVRAAIGAVRVEGLAPGEWRQINPSAPWEQDPRRR
jgi:16S rRNA U516 pseudouridylate synthase RsuA-like enzyme